jgi:hypothetical protein
MNMEEIDRILESQGLTLVSADDFNMLEGKIFMVLLFSCLRLLRIESKLYCNCKGCIPPRAV